ncbi:hypothetical protein D3C73_1317710 [compost metagenome]
MALDPMVFQVFTAHGQGADIQTGTLHLHTALLGAHPHCNTRVEAHAVASLNAERACGQAQMQVTVQMHIRRLCNGALKHTQDVTSLRVQADQHLVSHCRMHQATERRF